MARHVSVELAALLTLADSRGLVMLAYLLDAAKVEADRIVAQADQNPAPR